MMVRSLQQMLTADVGFNYQESAVLQAALARAGIQPASPVARVSGPRTLKLAIMPIQLPGATLPTTAELTKAVADLNAIYAATTGGKLKATAVIAPAFASDGPLDPYDQNGILAKAIASAAAHGVSLGGATPVFIGASPDSGFTSSYGGPALGALLLGAHWKLPSVWAHEIGHWLGLSHGRSPACSTPGAVASCSESGANEYGDYFDIMGSGADRFGAFQLRVLGLLTPSDAAGAAGAVATIAPPGKPGPSALRIRTGNRDWFVEARSESHQDVLAGSVRFDDKQVLPVGGVILSRAERRYATDDTGYFPNPYRFAPAVGVPCGEEPSDPPTFDCGAGQVFMPGTALTVPGKFRLDVLPPAADGTSQVKTTWLDKTPPVLKSVKGRIERPWGAPSGTLVVDLAGAADGAGIAAVEVKAGSKTTRVDADTLTDLIAGNGKASLRLKAPRSGVVRTTLVDAAGRRSTVKNLVVRKLKTSRPAGITYAPRGGSGYYTAPSVPAGTRLRVNIRTDPKTAGLNVYVWALASGNPKPKLARISKRGRASVTLTLTKGDNVQVVVQVPKGKGRNVRWVDQPRIWFHVG
jgi:hypothetical protein